MGEITVQGKVRILTWIFLVFALIFAAGALAWYFVAAKPTDIIKIRARHILVKVEPDPTPEQKTAAEAKILRIKADLDAGKDFATMAALNSDCPSSKQGGDLGWFGKGSMVKEFDDAVFGAETGKLIGPVETKFGYHLIEVTDQR